MLILQYKQGAVAQELTGQDTPSNFTRILKDSSGDIYVVGESVAGPGSQNAVILKFTSSGTLLWQRALGDSGGPTAFGHDMALDSSDNSYIVGRTVIGNNYAFIAKYNPSGVLQWQRRYGTIGEDTQFYGVTVTSDNRVIATGKPGSDNTGLVEYNTSGVLQKEWRITNGRTGIAIDSDNSGNYAVTNAWRVAYYNSSDVIQWQRELHTNVNDVHETLRFDPSGNVYVAGKATQIDASGNYYIAKYNSSGVLQWQQEYGNASSSSETFQEMTFDASGNVYATGHGGPTFQDSYVLAKYSPTGTQEFQRRFGNNDIQQARGVVLLDSNNALLAGYTRQGSPRYGMLAKLPFNVAATQTVGLFTYETTSETTTAGSMSDTVTSYTETTFTKTEQAGTLTDAAGSMTFTGNWG